MDTRRIEEILNLQDPFIDFAPEPGTNVARGVCSSAPLSGRRLA
jgi:hypothetical protein